MVLGRAARDLGPRRQLDALTADELRAWLVTLRQTLAPISVAGYVRGLKAFGNWCATERLAEGHALRSLRRPHVPHKLIEPLSDEALHRLLNIGSVRDRAIVLLLLDTGLRVSQLAGLRGCDLRPDGSVKVTGKGARERIVPVGTAARQALLRYLRSGEPLEPEEPILRAERGGGPLDARGIQSIFKRLKTPRRHPGALQPAPAASHLRPRLPDERRRCLQPAAHAWAHDAGHGQALRGLGRRGSGCPSPPGLTCGQPAGQGGGAPCAGSWVSRWVG
jgi:site-specific recombinase XerC